jgi:chromosome partitioning protein
MGYITSVVNNKGGVGKTTTTCNLADGLGKQGKKVLVVDADPQANTTTMLLPRETQIQKSFYDVLENGSTPNFTSGHIYGTTCKNVYILPNINETGSLEPTLIAQAPDSFMRLRNSLRGELSESFDFIIIDCPPNMGTFVLCALYASDFAIVPILARSTFSVQGLIKAVGLIKDIREAGNPNLRFLRLLINSVDKRTSISKTITEQVHSVFDKDQIFKTQIPVNTAFEQAEANRCTIFQHDGTSTGARAYRELAKELSSVIGA